MSQRVALLEGAQVVNVAEFPDDWTGDTWDGYTAVLADTEPVGPGWTHDGTRFVAPPPPPTRILGADRYTMTPAEVALITYTDTYPDAPASVTFDVNGARVTVALTASVAELDVTPTGAGPITITAVDRDVPPLTITVEEA